MGTLLANVAHELNNPLAVATMQLDNLQEAWGAGAWTEDLAVLRQAVDRCTSVVQSFLARARQQWSYEPTSASASLAAAYAFGLARAHPFSDGNKRTAFVTMMTFLGLNQKELSATEVEVVQMMVGLAGGEVTEAVLSDWIRARLIPLSL